MAHGRGMLNSQAGASGDQRRPQQKLQAAVYVCVRVHAGQRTTCWSWLFPSTTWVLGIELRMSPQCSLKVVSMGIVACSSGSQMTQQQISGSPHYIVAEAQAWGEDSLT